MEFAFSRGEDQQAPEKFLKFPLSSPFLSRTFFSLKVATSKGGKGSAVEKEEEKEEEVITESFSLPFLLLLPYTPFLPSRIVVAASVLSAQKQEGEKDGEDPSFHLCHNPEREKGEDAKEDFPLISRTNPPFLLPPSFPPPTDENPANKQDLQECPLLLPAL